MPRKLTIEEIKARLYKVHGDVVSLKEDTYIHTCVKAVFTDIDHGDWEATPTQVLCRGTSHPARKREKVKQTCLKRYGIENSLNRIDIRKKSIESRRISIETVKERLKDVHGDIVTLDEKTYINISSKCLFYDFEYGSWWATPNNVIGSKKSHPKRRSLKAKETLKKKYGVEKIFDISGMRDKIKNINMKKHGNEWYLSTEESKHKRKKYNLKKYGCECITQSEYFKEKCKDTCMRKYGTKHVMQNKEISLKAAKSLNNSYIQYHWKTNEELVCQASYELRVVQYLNDNKIDFKWQPEVFKLPNGRTYRPDLFLIEEHKWIEIKGYFRGRSLEKWKWFQKEYPNSELWNEQKLKEMKILS